MRTKQQLQNLIKDCDEWLEVNSKEHEARPQIEARRAKAIKELEENY